MGTVGLEFDLLALRLFTFNRVTYGVSICRIGDDLGSGQFGTVTKGIWQHSELELEVAVKLLKSESTEEERVMFLQEAAIMGQFNHPNILKIYGVVTLSEPVRKAVSFSSTFDSTFFFF